MNVCYANVNVVCCEQLSSLSIVSISQSNYSFSPSDHTQTNKKQNTKQKKRVLCIVWEREREFEKVGGKKAE